jgi:hypothetical protein
MSRGGKREGAGSKSKWIHGRTTVIRVPEALVEEVLRVTRLLDIGKTIDDVTQSKYINLSEIPIRDVSGNPAIFIEDLLRAGFKIRPIELISTVRKQIDRQRRYE